MSSPPMRFPPRKQSDRFTATPNTSQRSTPPRLPDSLARRELDSNARHSARSSVPANFPTSPVSPKPGSASPTLLYGRKAAAERRVYDWRAARLRADTSENALREAEAAAARHAASLRAALRDLDDAVADLREARRSIGKAVIFPRPRAHASCTIHPPAGG